ncbi:MAG: DUF3107 domain-containing protein [Actinomycetaceae bacterium]|nr:DUF3107 domain-containing protein [Actinomycetaceae bacterium]
MEITIGIRGVTRDIMMDVAEEENAMFERVAKALESQTIIEFTDTKGSRVMIPTKALGYVQVGPDQPRKVGFGI